MTQALTAVSSGETTGLDSDPGHFRPGSRKEDSDLISE